MPYVDRTVFTTNDQQSGEVADPNKLEANDSHLADVVDANYSELNDFANGNNISKLGIANVKDFGAKGDGSTDDTTSIQNAIDEVYNEGGGTVIIPTNGTFIITNLRLKENVKIISYGGVLKLKNDTCIDSSKNYFPITNENSGIFHNNIIIDGVIVDGNSSNNTSYKSADSITLGGENCVVKNCYIYNSVDSGIMFSKAKNSQCINNRIDNGRDAGIYINDGDGTALYESIVSGNRITGFDVVGIALKRMAQRVIVSQNTIYDCGGGITLVNGSTSSDYSENVTINNNRIRYVGFTNPSASGIGIVVRTSPHSIVTDNRIEEFAETGIDVEGDTKHSLISNNSITTTSVDTNKTYQSGIRMRDRDGNAPSRNVISDNSVDLSDGSSEGFRWLLLNAVNSGGNYNVASNNAISSTYRGMRIDSSYVNNIISKNTIKGDGDYDLLVYDSVNRLVDNELINGTVFGTITDYKSTQIKLGGYVLWVDSTGDLRIKSGSPTSDTDGSVVGTQA